MDNIERKLNTDRNYKNIKLNGNEYKFYTSFLVGIHLFKNI